MKQIISFAQKAFVLDKTMSKILTIKYLDNSFVTIKLKNKLGIPGGQLEFGEQPHQSLIREVKEETGVNINPLLPFYTWTWIYRKHQINKQIVAVAYLCQYRNGRLKNPDLHTEKESIIGEPKWIPIKEINLQNFIEDEQPVITRFLHYQKSNPFKL